MQTTINELLRENSSSGYTQSVERKLKFQEEYFLPEVNSIITISFGCQQSKETIIIIVSKLRSKGFTIKN